MRSLHFNDRVDLRQSAVLRFGEIYDYTSEPCNHVKTLSLGLAVSDSLEQKDRDMNLVVLGGGGCVLPAFIYDVFRHKNQGGGTFARDRSCSTRLLWNLEIEANDRFN